MERETGIEPATNSLEGCDSTTELLPPSRYSLRATLRLSRPAYVFAPCTGGQATHASRLFPRRRPSTTRCSLAVEQPPPHLSCFGCRTKGRLSLAEVGLPSSLRTLVLRLPSRRLPPRSPTNGLPTAARSMIRASEGWWRGKDSNLRSR